MIEKIYYLREKQSLFTHNLTSPFSPSSENFGKLIMCERCNILENKIDDSHNTLDNLSKGEKI